MNLGTAQVIRADARDLPLADNSVDLVVTSPPYFALRSYQDGGVHYAGQIGSEPTPAEFVAALLEVTRECVRVLKPSGSLWVNLGDKYNSGSGSGPQNGLAGGVATTRGNGRGSSVIPRTSVRPKSLIGIPWRYALACIDDLGLILRAEVIWSKPNGLPESVTDRVRRSHETWFHFTLEPRYFSAVDEIREAHLSVIGGPRRHAGAAFAEDKAGRGGDGSGHTDGHPLGKLPGSVWTVPTEPLRVPDHLGIDHFAAFPTEWPRRIINGWSPAGVCVECGEGRRPVALREGGNPAKPLHLRAMTGREDPGNAPKRDDACGAPLTTITGYACACPEPTEATTPSVILDPFGGTGTTALVAKALGRHGISVDMSADYCRLAAWRTGDRDQLAKVLGIAKAEPVGDQDSLLDLLGGESA